MQMLTFEEICVLHYWKTELKNGAAPLSKLQPKLSRLQLDLPR